MTVGMTKMVGTKMTARVKMSEKSRTSFTTYRTMTAYSRAMKKTSTTIQEKYCK